MELTKNDKVDLSRVMEGIQGRIDNKLLKFMMNLVLKTKVSMKKVDHDLFSSNLERFPDKSIESFSIGSFFGQTYQIGLDLAKKRDIKLDETQKRLLREFILFIVLFKFEKEKEAK